MKRIVALSALLILAGCAGNYKTTFETPEEAAPITVYVAPILNQEEISIQVVYADSSAATAQYGLVGALVGSVIDAAVNSAQARQAERRAEVVRELTADYDFVHAAHQLSLNIGEHERWKIVTVDTPVATEKNKAIAEGLLANSAADAIVLLEVEFALTPGMNQVRGDVFQEVYLRSDFVERGKAKLRSSRTVSYLSPVHNLNYREFREGEKHEMMIALQQQYDGLIAAQPEDEEDLRKQLAKESEDLEKLDQIPDFVAIEETWTTELLTRYLDQSMNHLTHMVQLDWQARVVPEQEERIAEAFTVTTSSGLVTNDKGQKISAMDDNTIYRSQWGSIYSVPAP